MKNTRLRRIEVWITDEEKLQRRRQALTWIANLQRVSTVALMEFLLATLEDIYFPDDSIDRPGFVDTEFQQPISKKLLKKIANDDEPAPIDNGNDIIREALSILGEYADKLRNAENQSDSGISGEYSHPEWDPGRFLGRFERVQEASKRLDTTGVT